MGVVTYDAAFYELEGKVAAESAAVVLPWLFEEYPEIRTVVDVGCGTGEWAAEAIRHGKIAVGLDLHSPKELHQAPVFPVDLAITTDFGRYDLAICLEVAEHLPAESGPGLVEALANSELVLFSAATPGQPGVDHINCQPHEYWHELFLENGFDKIIHLGPGFSEPVADFYQRNMYLYERSWEL